MEEEKIIMYKKPVLQTSNNRFRIPSRTTSRTIGEDEIPTFASYLEGNEDLAELINSQTFFELVLEFGITIEFDTLEKILRARALNTDNIKGKEVENKRYHDFYVFYLNVLDQAKTYKGKYYMRTLFNNSECKQPLEEQCDAVMYRNGPNDKHFKEFDCGVLKFVNRGAFFRLRQSVDNFNFVLCQLVFFEEMIKKSKEGALQGQLSKEDERPQWNWEINKGNLAVFKISDPMQILASADVATINTVPSGTFYTNYIIKRPETWGLNSILKCIFYLFQRLNKILDWKDDDAFTTAHDAIAFPSLHSKRVAKMMNKFKEYKNILLAKNKTTGVLLKNKITDMKIDYSKLPLGLKGTLSLETKNISTLDQNAKRPIKKLTKLVQRSEFQKQYVETTKTTNSQEDGKQEIENNN